MDIDVSFSETNDTDTIRLFESTRSFHRMNLSYNRITDDGILSTRCPIQILNISYTQITDIGLERLLTSTHTFHTLNLSGNRITDEGVKILSSVNYTLRHVNLSNTMITDVGVQHLAHMKYPIHKLNLSGNDITDIGAAYLADSKIVDLNISWSRITDIGLKLFLNNPHIIRLIMDCYPRYDIIDAINTHVQNNERRQSLQILAGKKVIVDRIELIPHALRIFLSQ